MTNIFMRRPSLHDIPAAPRLPEGYLLRQAFSPVDDAALAVALAATFGEGWDAGSVRARLTAAPDVRAVYVIVRDGEIAATASHRRLPERWPDAGCVHWVGTRPDHARKGLASALLAHLLREFAACGDRAAALETQEFRLPALRAYLKFGFLPVYDANGEDHRPVWSAVFQAMFADRRSE